MESLSNEYRHFWESVLAGVLQFDKESIERWMLETGAPHLAGEWAFHEEKWHLPSMLIVKHFCDAHLLQNNKRTVETEVFWLLFDAWNLKEVSDIDWKVVRKQCLACLSTYLKPEYLQQRN